ncbi:MAG TPA: HAD-IC family P-type ATPase, partial [Myxococcaceae bacterium]|nr:HAD-IC family P-type ATPase [Myxococcaceae bacterium]
MVTTAAIEETDPSTCEVAELVRKLRADLERGLSAGEATRRRIQAGPNRLVGAPPVATWRKLVAQFRDPLIYLLLAAIVISAIAWWVEGAQGAPVDAVVISAIVILNAVMGFAQEARAQNAVAALGRMTAVSSTVVREGRVERLPSEQLVPGDLLVLEEGDSVGADARLVRAVELHVSEASLTGESVPVQKHVQTLTAQGALGDRVNMVFKGTAVTQGVGRAVVTSTGMATEMGKIARLLEATQEEPTPLQKEIERLGRTLGLIVIAIAVGVVLTVIAVVGVKSAQELIAVLLLGVSLAVAAVPEGLPTVLSLVLALGVRRMAERKAIVKKLSSVETLGSASVICSDKTGTLTKSEMTLQRVVTASGELELSGVGYRPEGEARSEGRPVRDPALIAEAQRVLAGGSLSSNASLHDRGGGWEVQGDPTEASFLVAAHKLAGTEERMARYARRGELPFTSQRKRMSTLQHDTKKGRSVLITKGAPDVLLERCTRLQIGREVVPLDEVRRAR